MCVCVVVQACVSLTVSLCDSKPGAGAAPMMPGSPMMAAQQQMMRPQFPTAGAPGQPVF